MNFKNQLNKIVGSHISKGGFARAERNSKDEVRVENQFTIMNDHDKKFHLLISATTHELMSLMVKEFEINAANVRLTLVEKKTKEQKFREAFKLVDVDMICSKHDKVTCKSCFGSNYDFVPVGRTAAEFKKANDAIKAVHTESPTDRAFFSQLVDELRGKVIDNPIVLDSHSGLKNGVATFVQNYQFEYDNKRGFTGTICIPEYLEGFIYEICLDDSTDFESKRMSLIIEVETLYRSLSMAWASYQNLKKKNKPRSVADYLGKIPEQDNVFI